MRLILITLLLWTMVACDSLHSTSSNHQSEDHSQVDKHSYANLDKIHTKHLHLELDVDFKNRTIYGVARHEMINNGADTAIFDINGLMIQKVTIGQKGSEEEADMFIDKMDKDSILGQPLMVPIKKDTKFVNIYYQTTERSDALDWLDTNLTTSKTKPFLYTQGQAILTRTWIPLQDSPSNRITYSADVKVPSDLLAVMSASSVAVTLTVLAALAMTVAWPAEVTRTVSAAAAVTVVSAEVVTVTTVSESVLTVPAVVAVTVAKTSVKVPGDSSVRLVA